MMTQHSDRMKDILSECFLTEKHWDFKNAVMEPILEEYDMISGGSQEMEELRC